MLVLGRKVGQSIKIGDNVTIRVLSIDGKSGSISMGFETKTGIKIHRQDVYDRIKQQKTGEQQL